MIITPKKLKNWEACESQLRRFTKRYPKGVKVTKKFAVECVQTRYRIGYRIVTSSTLWADSFVWLGADFPKVNRKIQVEITKVRWNYRDHKISKSVHEKQYSNLLWQGWKLKGWA